MTKQKYTQLNLGCGTDIREGWINADVSKAVDPDVVVDLESAPWPFATGSFLIVEARHILEHLERVPWGEIERILKPGGTFKLIYPLGHTRFEDPTHKQFWNWHTAENIAGERKHEHELGLDFRLVLTDYKGQIAEPLARLYAWYRLALEGPGPWLEQIPGFAGERIAVYRYDP